MQGFTKRALEEQEFLKKNYPNLWKYYDEMMGNICIPNKIWQGANDTIRREANSIIAVETNYDGKQGRYVMFRGVMPDEDGNPMQCYVICEANEV